VWLGGYLQEMEKNKGAAVPNALLYKEGVKPKTPDLAGSYNKAAESQALAQAAKTIPEEVEKLRAGKTTVKAVVKQMKKEIADWQFCSDRYCSALPFAGDRFVTWNSAKRKRQVLSGSSPIELMVPLASRTRNRALWLFLDSRRQWGTASSTEQVPGRINSPMFVRPSPFQSPTTGRSPGWVPTPRLYTASPASSKPLPENVARQRGERGCLRDSAGVQTRAMSMVSLPWRWGSGGR